MENKRLHKEFHYFLLTDYEKEEEFLREKHKNGQKLIKIALPGIYYFEDCEPEDMVYRLDFNPQESTDRGNYLQMYADYGWEYLQDINMFSYFRKKAAGIDDAELEIFSDNESRLDMLKRIFTKRMLPILVIFLLCLVPQLVRGIQREFSSGLDWIMLGIWAVLFVVYIAIIGHCTAGFYRLSRKYSGK